jgi:hypothetical protein
MGRGRQTRAEGGFNQPGRQRGLEVDDLDVAQVVLRIVIRLQHRLDRRVVPVVRAARGEQRGELRLGRRGLLG